MVPQLLGNLLRRRPLTLVDGGSQRRSFTDIQDGIDGLLAILRLGVLNDGLINVIIQGPEAAAALAGLEDLFRVQGPVLFAPAALIHNG